MSLRTKTLLIVGVTLTTLVGTLSLGVRALLLRRLYAYELEDGRDRAAALQRSLDFEVAELGALAEDYANWDAAYAFMEYQDPGFIAAELPDETNTLRLNVVALADTSGKLVYGQSVNLVHRTAGPVPSGVAEVMASAVKGVGDGGAGGLVDLPDGPFLVAVRPILHHDGKGPPRGMLLLGRWLDATLLNTLTRRLPQGHVLRLLRSGDPATRDEALKAAELLSPANRTAALPLDSQRLAAYARIDDLRGGPGVVLALEMPRVVVSHGRASVGYLVFALVLTGLVFGGLVVGLLEKLVLSRLSRLSAEVGRIAARADAGARVSLEGSDELASLGRDVNGMLDALESSRRRLEASEGRLEESLLQAQKLEAVGRLAGGVAHDFNNLLNVILGHSELALRKLGDGHPAARNLAQATQAAERAATLTSQLLAFGRRQPLQPRLLDLNQVIEESAPMLGRVVGPGVELVIVAAQGGAHARGDPSHLQRALLELAANARDAMPEGGRLTIETRKARAEEGAGLEPGTYTALVVSDSGTGMDDETRRRAFEPFFTTKEQGKGTGLGLASVYGMVRQSGGGIAVDSVPGRGSVFTILLRADCEAAGRPGAPAAKEAAGPGAASATTILLVEDQLELRDLVAEVLESSGYRVIAAESARDARRQWNGNAGHIDLLVTDVMMPGGGGPALARELEAAGARLKVLFMSGYPDNALPDTGVTGRSVQFLQKPFTSESLLAKVRDVLAGP